MTPKLFWASSYGKSNERQFENLAGFDLSFLFAKSFNLLINIKIVDESL